MTRRPSSHVSIRLRAPDAHDELCMTGPVVGRDLFFPVVVAVDTVPPEEVTRALHGFPRELSRESLPSTYSVVELTWGHDPADPPESKKSLIARSTL